MSAREHQINVLDFTAMARDCASSEHMLPAYIQPAHLDRLMMFTCLCGRYRWTRSEATE